MMPKTERKARIYAASRHPVPGDSRREHIWAAGTVLYEDDWRVDFQADDGEVRVFMRDDWDIDLLPYMHTWGA